MSDYLTKLGGFLEFVVSIPLIFITPILLPAALVYTRWRDRRQ